MKTSIALVLLVMISGCASPKGFLAGDEAPVAIRKRAPLANTADDCRSAGGRWISATARPGGGYCQFKTHDAGRACRNSHDCEGYCELVENAKGGRDPRCSASLPPRWDRCVPGYYENGKILGRGECFGDDSEVQ